MELCSVSGRPQVAIVHDALVNAGGAERTLTFMGEAFPEAPIFTSAYLPAATYTEFQGRVIQVLPGAKWARDERRFKQLLPVWLTGFSRLNLFDFDIVLSSTTFAAKYVRLRPGQVHACYCYAPFRWIWKPQVYSTESLPIGGLAALVATLARPWMKRFDLAAMQRVSRVATTCQNMRAEIRAVYEREADVIYPPIRLEQYHGAEQRDDYYLCVSRLISHKRIDLAIQACERLGRPLLIVGDGPERIHLEALAGPWTRFLGRISDDKLKDLYSRARAVLFPSYEDYGLVPLEAQASGCPVIAYGQGGALETVQADVTGIFFNEQSVEAVQDALVRFETVSFDARLIRASLGAFGVDQFVARLRAFVLGQ